MQINYKDFKKAVITSQHCQRNWDLNKVIPEQDIEIFKHVVTNCPSKQNIAYYDVYFINNRKIIEEIHNNIDIEIEMVDEFTNPELYDGIAWGDGEATPKLHKNKVIIHYR